MTAPVYRDCLCGHSRADHPVEDEGECRHNACRCVTYRPRIGKPRQTTAPQALTDRALTERARTQPSGRVDPLAQQPSRVEVSGPARMTVAQLIEHGKRSKSVITARNAARIEAMAASLRTRLVQEDEVEAKRSKVEQEHAAAAARIAELERQIEAERQRLISNRPRKQCPECQEMHAYLGPHRFRKHGVRAEGKPAHRTGQPSTTPPATPAQEDPQ